MKYIRLMIGTILAVMLLPLILIFDVMFWVVDGEGFECSGDFFKWFRKVKGE